MRILAVLILINKIFSFINACADDIQRCGLLVEQLERHITAARAVAFRSCFPTPFCFAERVAFNECFAKSLDAVRMPLKEFTDQTANKEFGNIAEQHRRRVQECFSNKQSKINGMFIAAPDSSQVESVMAYAIYSPETSDAFWGLTYESTDTLNIASICPFNKDYTWISLPNIKSTQRSDDFGKSRCSLNSSGLVCYRRKLYTDLRYRELIEKRDVMMRSCLQKVNSLEKCKVTGTEAFTSLRSCICEAHTIMEAQMRRQIAKCMQDGSAHPDRLARAFASPNVRMKQSAASHSTSSGADEDTNSITLTPGVTLNGQCLCTCKQNRNSLAPFAASVDPFVQPPVTSRNFNNDASTSNQNVKVSEQIDTSSFRTYPTAPATVPLPATIGQQIWYYYPTDRGYQQQSVAPPRRRDGNTNTREHFSTESGIASGFDRFFNGLPP